MRSCTETAKKRKKLRAAIDKFLEMPLPPLDLKKIKAELRKHHKNCELCKLLRGE